MAKESKKTKITNYTPFFSLIGCLVLTLSCGTSGGIHVTPGQSAADAQKATQDNPESQALIKEFDTTTIAECREDGFFYDRRGEECLSDLKTKGFICTRDGIIQIFTDTGSQITQILDRSLGNAAIPGDKGESYVIDQCAKSASGRLMVSLIKKGPDGKLQVREIEAKKSPTKK